MPNETGTETARSDAPSADDSLFGETETPAAVAEETAQDRESPDDAGESDADGGPEQGQEDSGPAEERVEAGEDAPENDLKVVVSIKGSRATIGVQQPSSDPHIESFDNLDESGLTQEVAAVIERARARWEESPKHPAYERPAPPARRRIRRQQGTAQDATADTEQAQQQTLRLF